MTCELVNPPNPNTKAYLAKRKEKMHQKWRIFLVIFSDMEECNNICILLNASLPMDLSL